MFTDKCFLLDTVFIAIDRLFHTIQLKHRPLITRFSRQSGADFWRSDYYKLFTSLGVNETCRRYLRSDYLWFFPACFRFLR